MTRYELKATNSPTVIRPRITSRLPTHSTSSEPTICTETAVARPSKIMKTMERAAFGTPRASATWASMLMNINGRQTTSSPTTTTPQMIIRAFSRGLSTATIWPVNSPNLLAERPE